MTVKLTIENANEDLIKASEYLDEALDMENSGKLITKTIEELEEFEK